MTEIKLMLEDPRLELRALDLAIARLEQTPLQGEAKRILDRLRSSIEEQIKPAIEEPTEFGSIVRASTDKLEDQLWAPAPRTGDHYWHSETGKLEVWSELHDPEVLRVGIGEQPLAAGDSNLLDGQALRGIEDVVARGIRVLEGFRDQAITAERKDACQNAINILRELS